MLPANVFHGAEHEPFYWEGGASAALLIHGFPGTPADMRPLATVMYESGWTVQAILLPGFGAEIETLSERTCEEWINAITEALVRLQAIYDPVVLIGYSMGGALALNAAAVCPPSALALLAPFWKLDNRLWMLLPLLKWIFPDIRPFRLVKANFSDPNFRQGIHNFIPGIDLDDSEVQRQIREFRVPMNLLNQLRLAGRAAYQIVPHIHLPVLVVQGTQDELVQLRFTRQFAYRFPGPLHYAEVNAGHNFLNPDDLAWPQIERTILDFIADIAKPDSL